MKTETETVKTDDDRLLSEREVSEKFGIGLHPLRDFRHEAKGDGPPVTRIGRRVFYRQGGVRAWLHNQEHGAVDKPGVFPPYGEMVKALMDREKTVQDAMGDDYYRGSADLRQALALRMAPALERIFYGHGDELERKSLAFVPFPAAALNNGAGVDMQSFMQVVDSLSIYHTGVIVAEPGHSWKLHIEDWSSFAPFMDAAPERIVVYRADRLLKANDAPISGAALLSGDMMERQLREAAAALDLPFCTENSFDRWVRA